MIPAIGMNEAASDTNILVDWFRGITEAVASVETTRQRYISRIVWIELLAGFAPSDVVSVERTLSAFNMLEVTRDIALRTADLRRSQTRKMKLPDALIYATALEHGLTLVTRNTEDFEGMDGVSIPYRRKDITS